MKPLIGITTAYEKRTKRDYECLSYNYIKAVQLAGGLPILIPTLLNEEMDRYLDLIDGLILSGGEDIDPAFYGAEPISQLGELCPERDPFEMKIFVKALERKIPVLGICRGFQVINVALGGTLYQDIKVQQGSHVNHLNLKNPVDTLQHEVILTRDSKLYQVMRKDRLMVNSLHHQAVNKVGENLKVVGVSTDDIIEALEYKGENFVLGVQWHPEDLVVKDGYFLELFKAFIEEIKNRSSFKCSGL